MKVLVLTTRVPFIHGGAEELSSHLVRQLRLAGHEAEDFRIPFSWTPAPRLVDEILIAKNLRLSNVDRVIALKFPAYLVPARHQVIWLMHQFRQAYDMFDAGMSHLPRDASGDRLRAAIRAADEEAFRATQGLFALPEAANRVRRYHGIHAEPLATPLNDPELFTGGASEDFFLAGGRVNSIKRQALLIQALAYAPGVRLTVAGPPDSPVTKAELATLARQCGVEDRVTLDLRFLPREEIASLVNRCRASVYVPFDEDNVGYVSLEAFQARKPVIAATDSGGVLEIVKDGQTGLVADPTPEALGAAMTTLAQNSAYASRLGAAGHALLQDRDITWPKTLEKLLA